MFDTLEEVIAGGVTLILALIILLIFFRRGGRVKAGNVTVEDARDTTPTESTSSCDNYQNEHLLSLKALQESLADIKKTLLGLNTMQIAETEALDVLLGIAEGEEINGQVTMARKNLTRAQGFKDATESIGGQE
jgi:hypothetical protein